MASMPDLSLPSHSALTTIEGAPPSLIDPPSGLLANVTASYELVIQ